MAGTFLVGYDIETASESTGGFLLGAQRLHSELGIPWSIFLTGKTIEERTDDCLAVAGDPLLTLAQHTYSHQLLKTVYMNPGDGRPCHGSQGGTFLLEGASLEVIEEEITTTQDLYRKTFGADCRGLTSPWAYYRGLSDRPDVLRILDRAGLKWMRTDGRDYRDCQPVPLDLQPYFYVDQGFPHILECPIQGYQDIFYWERFDDRSHGERYEDYLYWEAEYVARNGLVCALCSHDHDTPTIEAFNDTKGAWLRAFFEHAQGLGITFKSYEAYYQERLRAQQQ